jgi:hypothetical protein
MVRVSVLNDALKTMYNAEKRGKRQVLLRPSSKVVIKFLQVMMRHGEALPHSSQTAMPMASVVLHLPCRAGSTLAVMSWCFGFSWLLSLISGVLTQQCTCMAC